MKNTLPDGKVLFGGTVGGIPGWVCSCQRSKRGDTNFFQPDEAFFGTRLELASRGPQYGACNKASWKK